MGPKEQLKHHQCSRDSVWETLASAILKFQPGAEVPLVQRAWRPKRRLEHFFGSTSVSANPLHRKVALGDHNRHSLPQSTLGRSLVKASLPSGGGVEVFIQTRGTPCISTQSQGVSLGTCPLVWWPATSLCSGGGSVGTEIPKPQGMPTILKAGMNSPGPGLLYFSFIPSPSSLSPGPLVFSGCLLCLSPSHPHFYLLLLSFVVRLANRFLLVKLGSARISSGPCLHSTKSIPPHAPSSPPPAIAGSVTEGAQP